MWKCAQCNEVFEKYVSVSQHRRIHNVYRPYQCSFGNCTRSLRSLSQLQTHHHYHYDIRRYQCKVCKVRFLSRSHLKFHHCSPHYRRLYRCGVCAARFLRVLSLTNHINREHRKLHMRRSIKEKKRKLQASQKKTKIRNLNNKVECDKNKILLKIRVGQSMTIISQEHDSKKAERRKSKKKHKKENKEQQKKRIVLSIKKGTVNLASQTAEEMLSKQKEIEKINGLSKPETCEYQMKESKSELKMTLKACTDVKADLGKVETYKVLGKSDGRSSLKLKRKSSSFSDFDRIKSKESVYPKKDNSDLKMLITKDKSGIFLAGNVQSVKPKKKDRENVFDSLCDVGMWKVTASPRTDRPSDILKLKLSPQKPVRVESLSEISTNNTSSFLGIPIKDSGLNPKEEISGEDSDVLETLPLFDKEREDKESDGGVNNVNDSGIEVLSSSSCNRSNGNSVHSVVLEEISPSYSHTEDSLLSLDSPGMDSVLVNKSEHGICHRCGCLILENNNVPSPGKCKCSLSVTNSPFQTPVSPLKINLHSPESAKSQESENKDTFTRTTPKKKELVSDVSEKLDMLSEDRKRDDDEDSDIMIITLDKKDVLGPDIPEREGKSRLKLKLKRGPSVSPQKPVKEDSKSPVSEDKLKSESPRKNLSAAFSAIPSSTPSPVHLKNRPVSVSENCTEKLNESNDPFVNESEEVNSKTLSSCDNQLTKKDGAGTTLPALDPPAVIVIDDNEDQDLNQIKECIEAQNVRKRPLFKSKRQDSVKDRTSSFTSVKLQKSDLTVIPPVEKAAMTKKPLFKKRTVSVDDKKENSAASRPLFSKQNSVPAQIIVNENDFIENRSSGDEKSNKVENDSVKLPHDVKEKETNRERNTSERQEKKLITVGLEDEDSLQQLSDTVEGKSEEEMETLDLKIEKPKKNPIDLFQQQFLSFLSKKAPMKPAPAEANCKSEPLEEKKETEIVPENSEMKTENSERSSGAKKLPKRNKGYLANKVKVEKKAGKPSHCIDGTSSKKVEQNQNIDITSNEKLERTETVDVKSSENENKTVEQEVSKSDSFSWLNIFTDKSKESNKSIQSNNETVKDVMAEINKKMDVPEDDDSNSLDMDDVFQAENLSSLEPKNEIHLQSNRVTRKMRNCENSEDKTGNQRYARKQTARRSKGKFKAVKRKVESEYGSSDENSSVRTFDLISSHIDSDPDFNPFGNSDDDFVAEKPKRRESRTCLRKKRRITHDYSDSENESRCSEIDRYESESQASRTKRSKRGRKSCCPCCLGSPRIGSTDHIVEHMLSSHRESYKLPRDHKQFVRNTLRLLQLQEKIHTLFLTLFPECSDIVKRSNLGTEEFELLIDDVLGSLSADVSFVDDISDLRFSGDKKQMFVEQHFDPCAINNIGMPFTTPDSVTRASEVDFVNNVDEKPSVTLADVGHSAMEYDDKHLPKTREVGNKSLWQHAAVFSQPVFTTSSTTFVTSSAPSLKFENNTLADDDEPAEEHDHPVQELISNEQEVQTTDVSQFISHHPLVTTTAQESLPYTEPLTIITDSSQMQHFDSADHVPVNLADHYHSDFDSVEAPGQPGITITLDLNALRVSLCRKPKACLLKLQNQLAKLSKFFLPELELKNYFYRNIDNLELLVDLMIEANSKDSEDHCWSESSKVSDKKINEHWPEEIFEKLETPFIKENDTVQVNFFGVKCDANGEERESLLVKYSDLFEQQIKSQRESLKKDLVVEEEEKSESAWKNAEAVLNSIKSLNKMAQRTRRPRETRLRKRSADEKRTLFVQEKLQNSQNSSFVCHARTRSGTRAKAGRRRSLPENSKERFLSELNLGDKLVPASKDTLHEGKECGSELREKQTNYLQPIEDNIVNIEAENIRSDNLTVKTNMGVEKAQSVKSVCSHEEESILKSGEKNIFDIMQPL